MISLREVEIFRPYTDEVPEDLLLDAGLAESEVDRWLASDTFRVAKRQDVVLGAYAMNALDVEAYELLGVIVATRWRRQGLGRWLVGHAIGVAESKGGRRVLTAGAGRGRMLEHIGFERRGTDLVFELIPE